MGKHSLISIEVRIPSSYTTPEMLYRKFIGNGAEVTTTQAKDMANVVIDVKIGGLCIVIGVEGLPDSVDLNRCIAAGILKYFCIDEMFHGLC